MKIDWNKLWKEFDEATGDWLKDGDKIFIVELVTKQIEAGNEPE